MKKRILFTILALALMLSLVPLTTSAATVIESGSIPGNLNYSLTDDGTLTISGTGHIIDYSVVNILPPWAADDRVTKVVMEEGVTSIGSFAFFKCRNIKTISIPAGVTSIGLAAFAHCSGIKTITIPASVTSIDNPFGGCASLQTLVFQGDGITVSNIFFSSSITAYYPHGNTTWTEELRESYGSNVTWKEGCMKNPGKLEYTTLAVGTAVPATCTGKGMTAGSKCSQCGEILAPQEEIPAKGHSYKLTASKPATCKERAHDIYDCSACQRTKVEYFGGLTDHTQVTIPAKAATCTETGLTEGKKCSVCDKILTAQTQTKLKEHTPVDIPGKAATCTETGLTTGKKCSVCDKILTAQIQTELKEHTPVDIPGKAATCTETGLTTGKKCSVCDKILTAQTQTELKEHTPVDIPGKAATCTETGLTTGKKCSVCDKLLVPRTETKRKEHTPVDIPGRDATCTASGMTAGKKCSVCDKILDGCKRIPAKGHDVNPVAPEIATLSAPGNKAYYECESCGGCFADKECTKAVSPESCIIPAVKTARLSSTSYTYNGKVRTPSVGVYDAKGTKLVKDTDYTVTYASGRKNVGAYKVTIQGKGNYSFTKTLTFKILPVKTAIRNLEGRDKGFFARWNKKTEQVTGYQLQYSLKRSFDSAKTKTISKKTTLYTTISKLKADKIYYVRVRTYKTVGNAKFYSAWSDPVRVKTQ